MKKLWDMNWSGAKDEEIAAMDWNGVDYGMDKNLVLHGIHYLAQNKRTNAIKLLIDSLTDEKFDTGLNKDYSLFPILMRFELEDMVMYILENKYKFDKSGLIMDIQEILIDCAELDTPQSRDMYDRFFQSNFVQTKLKLKDVIQVLDDCLEVYAEHKRVNKFSFVYQLSKSQFKPSDKFKLLKLAAKYKNEDTGAYLVADIIESGVDDKIKGKILSSIKNYKPLIARAEQIIAAREQKQNLESEIKPIKNTMGAMKI